MARSRNIKPSLFKNELLGEADPLLTVLFAGLWCLADREGRLEDRPKRIKAEIFPYRELDINRYLTDLEQLGFIYRYEAENQPCIQVLNFHKHQSPHKTERPSELPKPPTESDSCLITDEEPLNNETTTSQKPLIPDSGLPDSLRGVNGKFALPTWIPKELWNEWMKIRVKKKAVNSDRAKQSLVGKLEAIRDAGVPVETAIETAIERSWKSCDLEWLRNAGIKVKDKPKYQESDI